MLGEAADGLANYEQEMRTQEEEKKREEQEDRVKYLYIEEMDEAD